MVLMPPHEGIINMFHIGIQIAVEFVTKVGRFWRCECRYVVEYIVLLL